MITQRQALVLGLTKFTTSKPCNKCGSFERYASTGTCVPCAKKAATRQRAKVAAVVPTLPDVPVCLIVPGLHMCQSCPTAAGCPARGRPDTLGRAKFAFRNHATVSAAQARKLGMTICKPAQACQCCGRKEWRKLNSRYCLGCYDELLHV